MMRMLVIWLLVLICISCQNKSEREYKTSKVILGETVKAMSQKWSNLNGSDRTYPYILIDSTDVFSKELPYYLDKKQLLPVDEELNNHLQNVFEETSAIRIDLYSLNRIEFIVSKDVSILRDKTSGFVFCNGICDVYSEDRMLDENWYSFERKISH